MKKITILCVLFLASVVSANAQGFEREETLNSKKVVNCDMGQAFLVENTMAADTVYIILLDDKAYPRLNEWVKMEVGTRQETIEFLTKLYYTFDTMKKGDSFNSGLQSGNKLFYQNELGVKKIGATGNAGTKGYLRKANVISMLRHFGVEVKDESEEDGKQKR